MLDWGLVQSPEVSCYSCCSTLAMLTCLLQAFQLHHSPCVGANKVINGNVMQTATEAKKTNSPASSLSSPGGKMSFWYWNSRSKCMYREGAVKVPTEAKGFHYRLLSGSFLCYLRIAQSVTQPTLQSQNSSRTDIWLLAAPWELQGMTLLGIPSFFSPLYSGQNHYSLTIRHLHLSFYCGNFCLCSPGLCANRTHRLSGHSFSVVWSLHREIIYVAELTNRNS